MAEELTEHVKRELDTGIMGAQKMLSAVPVDVRGGCPEGRKLEPKNKCVLTCRAKQVREHLREGRDGAGPKVRMHSAHPGAGAQLQCGCRDGWWEH